MIPERRTAFTRPIPRLRKMTPYLGCRPWPARRTCAGIAVAASMTLIVFPAAARQMQANDGDAVRFCSSCAFSSACISKGLDKNGLRELEVLVEHVGPMTPGTHLFRAGESFDAIAAVRAGTVKTWRVDLDGREQVLGFHFPGEVIGLSAIDVERYPCNAVALDAVELCRFSFPRIAVLASRLPGLQQELFRLLSRDIGRAERLAGDHRADTRVAAFLIDLSHRLAKQGHRAERFRLTMSRADIASYLRLTPETLSRIFRRLQDQGLIRVTGRQLELADLPGLTELAAAALEY